jgi:hypothetical protein
MSVPISDDEVRAAEWREQRRRRVAFQLGLVEGLAGDPDAARAVHDAFRPLVLAVEEARNPTDPADDI